MTDALFHTPAAVAPVAAAGTDPVGTHALGVPAGALPVAQDLGDGSDTSPAGCVSGEAHAPAGPVLGQQIVLQINPRSRHTADEIISAYKETGSVWRAGKLLGIGGQTVHERLKALGYRLANQRWSKAETDELRALVANGVPLGQIARRLGRSYAGVTSKASELGIRSQHKRVKKLPRGAGFDKAATTRHMKAIEAFGGKITQYARANGLSTEVLVQALQKHCPDRWTAYVASRSDLPTATCGYCETRFIPFTGKQRFCDRKCATDARQDRDYFGGKRKTTIGLAEGVCQLCERHVTRGLSSHHVFGKENDPENDALVALCQGCHKIVTFLGSRVFVDNETAWESLISLVWMRKHGPEIAARSINGNTIHVCVDIDVYTEDGSE